MLRAKEDAVDAINRLIDILREESFKLILISSDLGLKELSDYEQASIIINTIIRSFEAMENTPAKIIICCSSV